MARKDPSSIFTKKKKYKEMVNKMMNKYGAWRGKCGIQVAKINEFLVRFSMQLLSCKLLRKCHRDEVPRGVIQEVEKCLVGVQMNWGMLNSKTTEKIPRRKVLSFTMLGY